ncbi:MAG: PEP-CTERM sorting domain-containing protein [Acidobacteria bacterium]|nr:PEP-CTERM sorting domain-containing protein [Acidobacteriota bacterium]
MKLIPIALLTLSTALASTIKVQFINGPNNGFAERTIDGGTTWTSPGFTMLNMRIAESFDYLTFCLEPLQPVSPLILDYNVVSLEQATTNIGGMGPAKAEFIRELIGRFYPVVGVALDNTTAGAMQMALWEIIREDKAANGFNVNAGLVQYRNESLPMKALAQSYLDALDGTGPKAMNLIAYTNADKQDILFQVQTPEPATYATLGAALLGLGWMRRRKN